MTTDGRIVKGQRRRRLLLGATMRVVERAGVGGVSQRAVAAEAGVPPSAVTYYFPTIDALLAAALADVNDRWLDALDRCAADPDPLAALARLVAGVADAPAPVAAEYELALLAARDPAWRPEYRRWVDGLDTFLARFVDDPVRRRAASVGVDGLLARVCALPESTRVDEVHAVVQVLTGPQ